SVYQCEPGVNLFLTRGSYWFTLKIASRWMKRSQATETIRSWILSGKLPRGVLLPPERTLADELGISRPTIRRAIEPLVQEGLLESQPGRGTLVPEKLNGDDHARPDWKVLALLLPDIANRFYSEVAESIEY